MTDHKKTGSASRVINNIGISVLIIVLSVIPLIVQLKVLTVDQQVVAIWPGGINADYFSYYKAMIISICACLLFFVLIYKFINKGFRLPSKAFMITLGVYTVALILSAIFSQYSHTAFWGFPDRFEGLFVLLSYIVLLLTTMQLMNNEKLYSILIISLMVSSIFIGFIGLSQLLNYDLLQSPLANKLVTFLHSTVSKEAFTYAVRETSSSTHVIFSTLYNPNTYGMYLSLLFPMAFFLSLFQKNSIQKSILLIWMSLLFINLLGTQSRGSIIASVIAILLISVLNYKTICLRLKDLFLVCIVLLGIAMVFNSLGAGSLAERLKTTLSVNQIHTEDERIDKIKDFNIHKDTLTIKSSNSVFSIVVATDHLGFYDAKGDKLLLEKINGVGAYRIKNTGYENYTLTIIDNFIKVEKGISYLYFAVVDQSFLFLNTVGEAMVNETTVDYPLKGYERMGSGRGYIWSRSLPILKRTFLLGTGPDTFAFGFPQKDYKGKLNYMYDAYLIIDKPHNMFLQMAINTGMLSLLGFIGMVLLFMIQVLKNRKLSTSDSMLPVYSIAISSGIVAYLISGLFTDSTVSVSPLFWVLLGMGMTIGLVRGKSDRN